MKQRGFMLIIGLIVLVSIIVYYRRRRPSPNPIRVSDAGKAEFRFTGPGPDGRYRDRDGKPYVISSGINGGFIYVQVPE